MVSIRPAMPDDHERIAELCAELSAHENVEPPALRPRHLAAHDFVVCLVAEEAGTVIGYALCYPGFWTQVAQSGLHMEDLIVTKAHRGRGVGRALIAAVVEETRRRGGEWVCWGVRDDNPSAIAFYDAIGAKLFRPMIYELQVNPPPDP